MRKSYSADCFQCGKSRARVRSFIGDCGNEGYFCNSECLQKYEGKDDDAGSASSEEEQERIDLEIESIRTSLANIVSRWVDQKYNEHYFAYICGLLSQGEQFVVVTKAQTFYFISKCQDVEKLRCALVYAKSQDCCVIL